MATLVLTTVGSTLGGPLGGTLGGLIGQSIDQGLFGRDTRKGPRLGDLGVQTSSYGSPIPQIFGKMRVAGTVVWATDLVEEEGLEGGGKGSPERVTYSYSANIAVALSSRPIIGVGRIWADGKLIRGASGDFKVKTKFRLAMGGEEQLPDPLISAVEGIASAPAYRGVAVAIFENLELAEFGNRIPLLTFEVVADDGPVPLARLLSQASGGIIDIAQPGEVSGFAAHGASVRDGLGQLIEMSGIRLVDRDGRLRSPLSTGPTLVAVEELGCEADGAGAPKMERRRASAADMPASLTLTYYDPDRDYQAGQATASAGGSGASKRQFELPAVLTAGEARRCAEQALARAWLAGETLKLRLPPSRMALRPGDALRPEGIAFAWTARTVTIEGMAVVVEAERAPASLGALPADPGRPIAEPDLVVGRSQLALFELPPDSDAIAASPLAWVAASNEGLWKSLPVELILGDQPVRGLAIGRRSVMGRAETVLDARAPHILDERSTVVVRLANSTDVLLNADLEALAQGANMALIGDELVQFGRAEQLDTGLFRLSKLMRGRRGTEWAAMAHGAGEQFCLLDPQRLGSVLLPASAVGATLKAVAHGVGDGAPLPSATRSISGEAMRPPPPCHLKAAQSGADVHFGWVRRSHRAWAWVDAIGDGADGFPELYRVTLDGPAGTVELKTAEPSILLGPSQIPGETGQSLRFSVATVGPAALSHPASITLTI